MAVIETPPKDRMAIETAVLPFSDELVARRSSTSSRARRADLLRLQAPRRIDRPHGEHCRELVPAGAAQVVVGHGQMDERELYRRDARFHRTR
ncbi:MAG: hypothetical protein R2862_06010 [Thermoanaerobaculia bacterium]